MSQTFVFLPPAACAGAQAALTVQRVADGISESLTFSQVLVQLAGNWTLVMPVEAVTACAVNLPTRKARWLRQALPFAVEELFAEDVELMHLALGEQLADGRHRVFAVRRSWLAAWLALCPTAPQAIAVDADLLPGPGTALLPLYGRWLIGGENVTRMAVHAQDWPQLSSLCAHPQIAWCVPQHLVPQPVDECLPVTEPFVWLAQQSLHNNLAQGEFAGHSSKGHWQRWQPLLGLVGLWLVLQWGFNLAQGWHLQHQANEYAAASAALYQKLFPQDSKLVNLRAQFDQHLQTSSGSGQSRLLGLLAQVSGAVAAEGGYVQISQVDFSEARGDLALQVQAAGFAELERLRERLQESGLAVQLGSASREGARVSARVVIGG
ncbi:type II secretion system protein GspL [Pseudomonas sp. TMP9]|uniref:type II secretion system protein GspL n=1 Tax=Pseudomonas sp. TMP9 TaxID=3133144 RepID=UPI0030CFF57F